MYDLLNTSRSGCSDAVRGAEPYQYSFLHRSGIPEGFGHIENRLVGLSVGAGEHRDAPDSEVRANFLGALLLWRAPPHT